MRAHARVHTHASTRGRVINGFNSLRVPNPRPMPSQQQYFHAVLAVLNGPIGRLLDHEAARQGKSQHLVSLDLKPLVLTFYLMIVFCSELSLQCRLCSAVANSKDRSHQSLVCRIQNSLVRGCLQECSFPRNNAMSKNRRNNTIKTVQIMNSQPPAGSPHRHN